MGPPSARRDPDLLIARHANAHHGVVDRLALRGFGLTDNQIAGRIATGRLARLHPGVYAVGHTALTREGRWLAAVLACGEDAVLSHASAAAAWAIRPTQAADIDVSLPTTHGRGYLDGVRRHRLTTLIEGDVTTLDAIPVTTPMRTLFDIAGSVRAYSLRRAATASIDRGLFDLTSLDALLTRHPRRQGTRPLRAMLIYLRDSEPITRSELERRFLRICRSAGVPRPETNLVVAGFEVDAVWPRERLILELDGRRWHEARLAMAADRARDRKLTIAGWRVVRVTWTDVVHDSAGVVADVRSLLARGGS